MDMYMPGAGGMEAARKIRGLKGVCGEVVLVAYTAYGSTELRSEAVEAGFNAFIVKPLDFNDLEAVLRLHLPAR